MAKQDVIAGLDMGSGRVNCLLGAQEGDGRIRVLGGSSVPCRGLKGGVVINLVETASAVTQAVEEAEAAAKQTVNSVYLGVRGGHLQSFNNRGAFNIARTDKEITAEDVQSVVGNAKAIPLSSDREILHVLPQSFSLDRQRGVPHPVGMEGSLLEVEVHIVTASSAHLNNIIKTTSQAGFQVLEPVYGLLAAGDMLVTPEEKSSARCSSISAASRSRSASTRKAASAIRRSSRSAPTSSRAISPSACEPRSSRPRRSRWSTASPTRRCSTATATSSSMASTAAARRRSRRAT